MEGEKLKPLTSQQIQLLKKTFRLLDTDSVAKRFYTTLFIKHPQVKALFPTELTELSTKLISVFELVVFSFSEHSPNEYYLHKDVLKALRALGQKHTEKGIDSAYYPLANEILLQSMKEEAGYIFAPEVEEAWKLAFHHLSTCMLSKDIEGDPSQNTNTIRDTFNYIKSRLLKS